MDRGLVERPSWDIARERSAHAATLARAIAQILERLQARPEVRRAILFGSYAAGRRDLFTDLDLLVVMDSTDEFVTRTASLYRDLAPGVDLDLLVYTPQEFERLRHSGFVCRAVETGTVLLER